jgi:hypothetical protein
MTHVGKSRWTASAPPASTCATLRSAEIAPIRARTSSSTSPLASAPSSGADPIVWRLTRPALPPRTSRGLGCCTSTVTTHLPSRKPHAWPVDGKVFYVPGFIVDCVDTGDVFHGAFCYAVIKGMSVRDGLEFSCAIAALNCTKLGARGGIAAEAEAWALMATAQRRAWSEAGRV